MNYTCIPYAPPLKLFHEFIVNLMQWEVSFVFRKTLPIRVLHEFIVGNHPILTLPYQSTVQH